MAHQQETVRRMFHGMTEAQAAKLHQRLGDWRTASDRKTRRMMRQALVQAGFVASPVSV